MDIYDIFTVSEIQIICDWIELPKKAHEIQIRIYLLKAYYISIIQLLALLSRICHTLHMLVKSIQE